MTGDSDSGAGDRDDAPAPPDGLQAERTALAWSRTALGVAGNAALLVVHETRSAGSGVGWLAVAFAMTITLATTLVGVHRRRTLRRRPLPRRLASTVALPAVGCAITALALVAVAVTIL